METQGISQGSIRNSHREIHAVKRKYAPASFQELARKLVESCSDDLIIRQRLDPERAKPIIQRGGFYVMENEGRADPGFLVFLPGKPVIYMQIRRGGQGERKWIGCILRMRVSTSISDGGGTVMIATLDDVLHRLRLEDVWQWKGKQVIRTEGFSNRRVYLKEFVEHHWVPDARLLGGIFTSVAHPMSLEQFSAKKDWTQCHSIEFIPEMAGKRRMIWFLEAQVKAAEAHAGLKQGRTEGGTSTQLPLKPDTNQIKTVVAKYDSKLPDIYHIYENNVLIGDASVQQISLSKALREKSMNTPGVDVVVEWNKEFDGYVVTALCP